jgi:hypothetical protein
VTPEKWLLLPVFLHFFMLVVVGVVMGRARFAGVADGRVKRDAIYNNSKAWPDDILKIGNNFDNQFQLPPYWYFCVVLVLLTGMVDKVLIALSWVFLMARLLHTIEHTGSNSLRRRFYFYLIGFVALTVMWLWFAVRFFVAG